MDENLRDKVDDNELAIDSIKDQIDEILSNMEGFSGTFEEFVEQAQTQNGGTHKFAVHWIDPVEEADTPCTDIDTVQKAQKVFSKAAIHRDKFGTPERTVQHGDIMVLMCENPGEELKDPDEPEDDDVAKCYFVGMAVENDSLFQVDPPEEPVIVHTEDKRNEALHELRERRHFIAWSTCGGKGDNYAFQEPEFTPAPFCIHPETGDATGIKLDFEEREEGASFLSQKAFVPLLPSTTECPFSGDIEVIHDLTFNIDSESVGDSGDCMRYTFKITPQKKRLSFSGGILLSEEEITASGADTIQKSIQVNSCTLCASDDYPDEFTYTVTVTQTPEQEDNAEGTDCEKENGGTFTLTRGHTTDAFGIAIPEGDECFYYMDTTLAEPGVCDPYIQYKYVDIDDSAGTFNPSFWNHAGVDIAIAGTFTDPDTNAEVAYDLQTPGGYYAWKNSTTTHDVHFRLSW